MDRLWAVAVRSEDEAVARIAQQLLLKLECTAIDNTEAAVPAAAAAGGVEDLPAPALVRVPRIHNTPAPFSPPLPPSVHISEHPQAVCPWRTNFINSLRTSKSDTRNTSLLTHCNF